MPCFHYFSVMRHVLAVVMERKVIIWNAVYESVSCFFNKHVILLAVKDGNHYKHRVVHNMYTVSVLSQIWCGIFRVPLETDYKLDDDFLD